MAKESSSLLLLGPPGFSAPPEALEIASEQGFALSGGLPSCWILPSQQAVEAARAGLCEQLPGGLLGTVARTLRQAADAVLISSTQSQRPLSQVQRQRLIQQVLAEAEQDGKLTHFDRVRDRVRLSQLLSQTFAENARSAGVDGELPRPLNAAQRELNQLDHRYRAALSRYKVQDDELRMATAVRKLRAGNRGRLGELDTLFVSGFLEFSPLEVDFLAALADLSRRCVVVMPWPANEAPPELEDLASSSRSALSSTLRATLAILQQRLPKVSMQLLTPSSRASDSETRVSNWLFRDPRSAPPWSQPGTTRYRVIAAEGTQEEVHQVAAQVKGLLLSQCSAEQVLLASRRVEDFAARAEQAFLEIGVPFAASQSVRLRSAPVMAVLGGLLRLANLDWRREDLLALVTSPALGVFHRVFHEQDQAKALWKQCREQGFAGPRGAMEWVLKETLLPGGQHDWARRCQALASLDELSEGVASAHRRRLAVAASVAVFGLRSLSDQLSSWSSSARPLEWYDRMLQTLRALDYRCNQRPLPGKEAPTSSRLTELDTAAIAALEEAFASLESLAHWQGDGVPSLSSQELATLLAGWGSQIQLDPGPGHEGRVRLVSVENARLMRPRHLFLLGMSEQAFPAPPQTSPLGDPGVAMEAHYSREMLLFYDLCHTASEGVTFSFPALDSVGQALSPSSYLAEVERLLAPAVLRVDSDAAGQSVSPAQWHRDAVRGLNQGDDQALSSVIHHSAQGQRLAEGLSVSLERARNEAEFGANEGVLTAGAARVLHHRYGEQHLWSPTQLETYAVCPFKFYLKQVLGVEPVAEFDLSIDYRRRGSLLHNAMVFLHEQLQPAGDLREVLRDMGDEQFMEAYREAIEMAKQQLPASKKTEPLIEVEAMQAITWGQDYHQQLGKYGAAETSLSGTMKPRHFEVRFGPTKDPNESLAPPSRPEPYEMQIEGERIKLTGQIDRIDIGEIDGQVVFNIVDYKTAGSVSARSSSLLDGRQLQLYLYTLAAQHHLLVEADARPWRLGYWALRDGGFKTPAEKSKPFKPAEQRDDEIVATEDWIDFGRTVQQRLGQIVRGVREGEYPMLSPDEHCGQRCEFRTTCRVAQTRSLQKCLPGQTAAESEEDPRT